MQFQRERGGFFFIFSLFFDQLAAWTTYWPWSDLCRDFIRPCSIKSALWLSAYVPSQRSERPPLIDVTAKCQVIMAVIVRLRLRRRLMDAFFTPRACLHVFALWNAGLMRVFLFFSDFANVSNKPFFFAATGLVGKLFIILRASSGSECEMRR